jgi:hypothetical protein
MHTRVIVRGSEICETMTGEEPTSATFALDGRPLSAGDSAGHRAKLQSSFAVFAGHTICTQNIPGDGGTETVVGTLDGKRVPAGDYPMKWVAPNDGWRVAP